MTSTSRIGTVCHHLGSIAKALRSRSFRLTMALSQNHSRWAAPSAAQLGFRRTRNRTRQHFVHTIMAVRSLPRATTAAMEAACAAQGCHPPARAPSSRACEPAPGAVTTRSAPDSCRPRRGTKARHPQPCGLRQASAARGLERQQPSTSPSSGPMTGPHDQPHDAVAVDIGAADREGAGPDRWVRSRLRASHRAVRQRRRRHSRCMSRPSCHLRRNAPPAARAPAAAESLARVLAAVVASGHGEAERRQSEHQHEARKQHERHRHNRPGLDCSSGLTRRTALGGRVHRELAIDRATEAPRSLYVHRQPRLATLSGCDRDGFVVELEARRAAASGALRATVTRRCRHS